MSVRPVSHYTWQVLRTAKRNSTPQTGRQQRVNFSPKSRNGSFLTRLVEAGLLVRVTGSADAPFEATYTLSALGEHAAEYGEYDHNLRPVEPVALAPKPVEPASKRKRSK